MLCKVVFPNPHDTPAIFTQNAVDPTVPRLVANNLFIPKLFIGTRAAITTGATVPETAVHEEHQPVPPKKKIRLAENILVPTPSGDMVPTKKFHQGQLSGLVATAANFRHHFRPFAPGKNIGHRN